MNRRSLGVLAIIIIFLMAIVATAGLDNLPRQLRNSVSSASAQFDGDRSTFAKNREFVEHAIQNDPALFRTKAEGWRSRLAADQARLEAAASELKTLQQLAKENRRTDAGKVSTALAKFQAGRDAALRDAADARADAERWLQYKKDLPGRLEAMRSSFDALRSFDVDAAVQPARKAMVDWPAKQSDLQSRIDALNAVRSSGEAAWNASAPLRSAAEAGRLDDFDYATFFQQADRVDAAARELKEGAQSLNTLAAQLYVNWDKLLLEVDADAANEKIRIVRTKYPDATLAGGETTSEEHWEKMDAAQARETERNVGMVVAHKPVGKYDSEAERSAQPPAYAYVAPPGQSNAYGMWSGGVWHWLPQYIILSHLLNSSRGAITSGDFYSYRDARRRGEVFRGWSRPSARGWSWSERSRPSSSGAGWYKERPKRSWGVGGFSGSQYRSRGGFAGSRYQSRGTFGSRSYSRGFGSAMRSFGRGGRR
jgi:hypothetical protein